MAFNTHPISDENREYCIMSEKDIAWRNTFLWIYTIAHVKAVSSYSVPGKFTSKYLFQGVSEVGHNTNYHKRLNSLNCALP